MNSFIRPDLAHLRAYTSHAKVIQQESNPIEIDRLDTNESPFDLPDDLQQKLAWSLQTQVEANRYPNGDYHQLKQAIAEYVTESAQLHPSLMTEHSISVGNGSDELIRSLLIATCLNGAGSILVADPTFSMYAILAQTLGIPVMRVGRSPVTFAIDWETAQTAINQPNSLPVRVVFVVHPNSPTGNSLTSPEIDWLKSLPEHILVVIDEAYFEFSQTTLASELLHHPNWVILRTFSKALRLAAYRVGYAIASPDLIAVLEKIRLPYNLPTISQLAAHLALTHRHQLLATIPDLLQERDKLAAALCQHPAFTVWQSQANFLFVKLKAAQPPELLAALHRSLLQQGTLIRQIAGGFRLTIGTAAENARTLDRVLTAISD